MIKTTEKGSFTFLERGKKSLQIAFSVFLFLLIFATALPAQTSRKALEARRHELISQISETNQLLKTIRQNRKTTVNQYITLQDQIAKRQELINTLEQEIEITDLSVSRAREVVFALEADVEILKKEYAEMARKAYRLKLTNNSLLFVLSADSFNEGFRRWNYLKQYDEYRQKQAVLIEGTQTTLSRKAVQLQERKSKKELLLKNELSQKNILTQELSTSDQLLARLRTDEVRVESELDKKKSAHNKLNQSISKIISSEIARQQKEVEKEVVKPVEPARTPSPNPNLNSPAEPKINTAPSIAKTSKPNTNLRNLSSNFNSNQGKLPPPVENGIVVQKFGNQPHPTLKNVRINNNGIDIQTEKNANINAVFDGEVLGLKFIPGNNYMVILQHGEYFTVYSNLEEVFLRRGDKVKTGEVIGKVALDKISGNFEVHFEVWKNKELMNPSKWITR